MHLQTMCPGKRRKCVLQYLSPIGQSLPVGVNVLVLRVMRKRIRISTKEVPHLSGSREAPGIQGGGGEA